MRNLSILTAARALCAAGNFLLVRLGIEATMIAGIAWVARRRPVAPA